MSIIIITVGSQNHAKWPTILSICSAPPTDGATSSHTDWIWQLVYVVHIYKHHCNWKCLPPAKITRWIWSAAMHSQTWCVVLCLLLLRLNKGMPIFVNTTSWQSWRHEARYTLPIRLWYMKWLIMRTVTNMSRFEQIETLSKFLTRPLSFLYY